MRSTNNFHELMEFQSCDEYHVSASVVKIQGGTETEITSALSASLKYAPD